MLLGRLWRLFFVYFLSKTKEKLLTKLERKDSMLMLHKKADLSNTPMSSSPITNNLLSVPGGSFAGTDSSSSPMSSPGMTPLVSHITHHTTFVSKTEDVVVKDDETSDDEHSTVEDSVEGIKGVVDAVGHGIGSSTGSSHEVDIDDVEPTTPTKGTDPSKRASTASSFDPREVQKLLKRFSILGGRGALSGLIALAYGIHFTIFVILILTDLTYYKTTPFLYGCPSGKRVYAVLALTIVYVIICLAMLIAVWRLVKENWNIRQEVFIVMAFWLLVVILFFVSGVWGSYNTIYEHYFPGGWIILFGCIFDNIVSVLVPCILSLQQSRYTWTDTSGTSQELGATINNEIREILYDNNARKLFKQFSTESFVPEGILFWEDARNFKKAKTKDKKKKYAQLILDKYIKSGAALELNLPNRKVWETEITEKINSNQKIPDSLFQKLINHAERDMMDIFVRFKRTSEYKQIQEELEKKKKEAEVQKEMGMR